MLVQHHQRQSSYSPDICLSHLRSPNVLKTDDDHKSATFSVHVAVIKSNFPSCPGLWPASHAVRTGHGAVVWAACSDGAIASHSELPLEGQTDTIMVDSYLQALGHTSMDE